jgi:hypothetical protein
LSSTGRVAGKLFEHRGEIGLRNPVGEMFVDVFHNSPEPPPVKNNLRMSVSPVNKVDGLG